MHLLKDEPGNKLKTGKENFADALQWFAAVSLIWLAFIVLSGLFEFIYNKMIHGTGPGTFRILYYKLVNDLVFWLGAYPMILLPFIACWFFSIRLAKGFLKIVLLLLLVINILLVKYFSMALVLLGADLYVYSWMDIEQTIGASGGIQIMLVVAVLIAIALFLFVVRFAAKRMNIPGFLTLAFPVAGIIMYFTGPFNVAKPTSFNSDFTNSLVVNKTHYFITQSRLHFFPVNNETDIYADGYLLNNESLNRQLVALPYLNETAFPFLHADSTQDVLSPFFNRKPALPDIVIIIVEGLGRAFTNEGAYLGNFTPFLDSLSKQSLYWENFLSEGGRTFAVLPSLLGSLPFARNGFLELGAAMPPQLSLVNLLKKNGYHSSFYYGGDAHFDNMDIFLQKNGIDELNDGKTFSTGYEKIPANNGFTWGYNDKALFRRFLDTRQNDSGQPQLSIVLTVSTHSPFLLNEPEKYNTLFEDRMNHEGFDESSKEEHRLYKAQYASIMYMDDALRNFFTACAGRKNFGNTIFLVTGDHRMPEIPMRTKIDRFHVPLIIYSPLLKRNADFLSISTHFDITPSLLSFLYHTYDIPRPGEAGWMGSGLDTARNFRNIHSYPLMQTKNDLVDYILNEYHLNNTTVFRMKPDMNEEVVTGEKQVPDLKASFDKYKRRNEKWLNGAPLIPDSLYRKYAPL